MIINLEEFRITVRASPHNMSRACFRSVRVSPSAAAISSLSSRCRHQRSVVRAAAAPSTEPRVCVFSACKYELATLRAHLPASTTFIDARLDVNTAALAGRHDVVCSFVNDDLKSPGVLDILAERGVRLCLLRCAGTDSIDLARAAELGITVCRVPAYDPLSVAEHAVGMMLSLNRHLGSARDRVRGGNFVLDGLVGHSLRGLTLGVVGTGKIGRGVADICAKGFDMRVLGYDQYEKDDFVGEYRALEDVLAESDVVSLHVPLTPETKHLIYSKSIATMKRGVMLINTSRGGLIDAKALLDGLYSGKIGALGADVLEDESRFFFQDFSKLSVEEKMMTWDQDLAALCNLPQVIITPHIAFLTHEALEQIASTTAANLDAWATGAPLVNECK